MNQRTFPINSIVTCLYTPIDKPSYQIIARVTKPTQWQILQGGWNHRHLSDRYSSLYSLPYKYDKDYSNFQVYTDPTTFPNPELLI